MKVYYIQEMVLGTKSTLKNKQMINNLYLSFHKQTYQPKSLKNLGICENCHVNNKAVSVIDWGIQRKCEQSTGVLSQMILKE